jgi:hypothetical protein
MNVLPHHILRIELDFCRILYGWNLNNFLVLIGKRFGIWNFKLNINFKQFSDIIFYSQSTTNIININFIPSPSI